MFGEAFGQIFAPGQSWMFGLPGAVLFYCVAGALLALPEDRGARHGSAGGSPGHRACSWSAWHCCRPGLVEVSGRVNPTGHATPGAVTIMARQMAATPQPHLLSSWVAAFARFDAAHGWGVNLFVVVALAGDRCPLPHRPPTARLRRCRRRDGPVPGRLGAGSGPRLHGRRRHRPQQHDPDDHRLHRRVLGPRRHALPTTARSHRSRRFRQPTTP